MSPEASKILEVLVLHLEKVKPGKPETYIGYKHVHDILRLAYIPPTFGESLKKQGLEELALWTVQEHLPGITGIVIDSSTFQPGAGYFRVFGKREEDYAWWASEVAASKAYDWSRYLAKSISTTSTEGIDIDDPAERSDVTISRIIRDTALSNQVKFIHSHKCQLCGVAIELAGGEKYAEAHHIRPLGMPHNGPDIPENLLCVCPNHHVQLDFGAIRLNAEDIRNESTHAVADIYLDYHNAKIFTP